MTREENFALKLKKLRKENNMTQKELAQKLCVSDKNLSKWECGRSTPDIFYLQEICKIFNVDAEYFFTGEDISQNEKTQFSEREKLNLLFWRWIGVILCLSSIALFVAVVSRIFMPTTVLLHFNGKGEVDRWGSSREYIAVGSTFCLLGYIAFFMKFNQLSEKSFNKKTLNLGGFILLIIPVYAVIFTIIYAVKMNNMALDKGYLPQSGDTFASLFNAILCMLYILGGAVCLGVKQNGAIGLRIPLTLENEKAWYILNRGVGLILIIVSEIELVIIGVCNLLPTFTVLIMPFIPIVIMFLSIIMILKIQGKRFLQTD